MNTVGKFVCTKGELPTSINYSVEQKSKGIRYVSYLTLGDKRKAFVYLQPSVILNLVLVWFGLFVGNPISEIKGLANCC